MNASPWWTSLLRVLSDLIMTNPSTPTIWNASDLETHVKAAIDAFVDRRLGESADRFPQHVNTCRKAVKQVLRHLREVDLENPDPIKVQAMLASKNVFDALRYLAGPPISFDDLGVLVTRGNARISKTNIQKDPDLAVAVFKMILQLVDHGRFPWIASSRKPQIRELKSAIKATASLHASQAMQTERRAYGKVVEGLLITNLTNFGYTKAKPKTKELKLPADFPAPATFFGECSLHGRRADLVIGLHDGRIVAVESKDSSSVVNSVKRVLNDTAAKARLWHSKLGDVAIPVALLSGVFGLENLIEAQKQGLFLVWSHNLDDFTNWLKTLHPAPAVAVSPAPTRTRKKP